MYPVSDAFLQSVQENTRNYYWTGKITTKTGGSYEFGYQDIVRGSGYISRQCCGSTEIELGTVYAAEVEITLLSQLDRYTLEDAKIELYYHLRLADGSYEKLPMGIFEISEANRHIKTLELKAYDYMLRFEKNFNGFETIGTAYDFLALCCKACDVELAQTQEQIAAFPNADITLSIYPENDIETYRDVLYYTAQVLGCFCCINREGKLELRKYGSSAILQINSRQRFSSSFSDFITRYTAVNSTNLRTQIAEYYALETDDGLTMNLGVNPLLQFGLVETRKQLCENILKDLSVVAYIPFDSDTIGNPALDLGDILTFSGGQADESKHSCITAIQYKIGGKQTLKCVGKNPRLALAVELPVVWQEDGKAEAYVTFELNDEEILTFHPQESWHSGKHVLPLYYPIEQIIADYTNTFNVYLRMAKGTGNIGTGECIASISGQSMAAAAAWDGKINIEEMVGSFALGGGLRGRVYLETIKTETMELVQRSYTDQITGRTGIGAFCRPIEMIQEGL